MQCPVCSAELPNTAKFCGSCGTTLSPPPAPPPSAPTFKPQPSPSPGYQQAPPPISAPAYGFGGHTPPLVQKKYKALRLIAVLLKILAVIAGAGLIIGGLVMAVAGAASSTRTAATPTFGEPGPAALFGGLVGGLVLIVYGVFVFVFLYAYAEWMYVFMDIEENTRLTNEMLSARK
jgi:zinc-ribbon domain